MTQLIDRQLVRAYFKSYLICLTSLLGLYIVVDLFTNLDDFSRHSGGVLTTLRLIGVYYGYQVTKIFDRLCEAILLMAAMFTVAWMQRSNEILPLLSAGVSTRRIVRPVLLSAAVMLGVSVLNQEFVIPQIGARLLFQRDDPGGEREVEVRGAYESNLIHLTGEKASRRDQVVYKFQCLIPENLAGSLIHLTAEEARYVPPGDGPRTGGWELTRAKPAELDGFRSQLLEPIDKGKYFLRTSKVDFETLTRDPKTSMHASTLELYHDLQDPDATRALPGPDRKRAVLFHSRLTRPVLGMLLVLLGLSVLLGDQNRNVIISAGLCVILCAVFFGVGYLCRYLGENNFLSPALAAWLPVLLFTPIAIVKFDAVHT